MQLLDHKNVVSDLASVENGNGTLISTSLDGKINIWNLIDEGIFTHSAIVCSMFILFLFVTGNLTKSLTMNGFGKPVNAVRWSPNAKTFAAVGEGNQVSQAIA